MFVKGFEIVEDFRLFFCVDFVQGLRLFLVSCCCFSDSRLFGMSIDTPQSQYGKACLPCHIVVKVTW